MMTVTGVRLFNWFRMGITDLEDLQWLLNFYHREDLPICLIGSALIETREAWPEKLGRPSPELLNVGGKR